MSYITWALIGMLGYSLTTLFVKVATRNGKFNSFFVLSIAVCIVAIAVLCISAWRGDFKNISVNDLMCVNALWSCAAGIALTIAVASLFKALSLGPASVVVPVYGMFIVGGAILGFIFLHEPVTLKKVLGIALAVIGIFLITKK